MKYGNKQTNVYTVFFFLQNRLKLRSIRITNPITRASSTGNLSKLSLSLVTLYEMMVYDAHTFIVSWFYETTTFFFSRALKIQIQLR